MSGGEQSSTGFHANSAPKAEGARMVRVKEKSGGRMPEGQSAGAGLSQAVCSLKKLTSPSQDNKSSLPRPAFRSLWQSEGPVDYLL